MAGKEPVEGYYDVEIQVTISVIVPGVRAGSPEEAIERTGKIDASELVIETAGGGLSTAHGLYLQFLGSDSIDWDRVEAIPSRATAKEREVTAELLGDYAEDGADEE